MKFKFSTFLGLSCSLLMCQNAFAAGYGTGTTSTSGLATSYAGSVTGIHDASDMFFNPAILADSQKGEFILSLSYLNVDVDPDGATAQFSGGSAFSGTEVSDAGQDVAIPALYLSAPISDDTTFGFSVTTPFGLSTKYDKGWAGRFHSLESSIETYNFNPSISHKLSDKFSVGVGVQAQYYKATLTKMAYNPLATPNETFAKLHGSDWGYGYNLGATYKHSDALKFGVGYRSKIDYKLTGTSRANGFGLYSDVNAKTTTPESLTLGTAYKLSNKTEVAYDMTWTRWSRNQSIIVNAPQNSNLNSVLNYNFRDAVMHSIGGNHQLNDNLTLRAGVAYEKGAITDANRHPSIPNGNKIWTSFGFNYKINNGFSVDAAYVHQFFEGARTRITDSSVVSSSLDVKYKTRVDVFSLALKQEF